MKKIIILTMLLAPATFSFSQQTDPIYPQPDINYLRRSKTQKTFGWILTSLGVATVALAASTQDYVDAFTGLAGEKNTSSPLVYAAGGGFIAGGVVLLNASSKNKRKAASVNVFLKMERTNTPPVSIAAIAHHPALGLRLSLP